MVRWARRQCFNFGGLAVETTLKPMSLDPTNRIAIDTEWYQRAVAAAGNPVDNVVYFANGVG